MTVWGQSGNEKLSKNKNPSQNVINIVKGGNNLMMPGSEKDYNIIIDNLKKGLIKREDILHCASKAYESIELLNN